jgi:hypothetical protein
MNGTAEDGDQEMGRPRAHYLDGTNSKLDVYLDQSLEMRRVIICAPITSTIHCGKVMPE